MKLTEQQLKQLIQEELVAIREEEGETEPEEDETEPEEAKEEEEALPSNEAGWNLLLRGLSGKYKKMPEGDERAKAYGEYEKARKDWLQWRKANLKYEQ